MVLPMQAPLPRDSYAILHMCLGCHSVDQKQCSYENCSVAIGCVGAEHPSMMLTIDVRTNSDS